MRFVQALPDPLQKRRSLFKKRHTLPLPHARRRAQSQGVPGTRGVFPGAGAMVQRFLSGYHDDGVFENAAAQRVTRRGPPLPPACVVRLLPPVGRLADGPFVSGRRAPAFD